MDIQGLKNACNEKYAQAIESMEKGEPNMEVARLLLEAAELLVKISKTDFLTRTASESKAEKLLSAAKKLRTVGDASAVYRDLTGRILKVVPKKVSPSTGLPEQVCEESIAPQTVEVRQIAAKNKPEEQPPGYDRREPCEDTPTKDKFNGFLYPENGKGKANGKEGAGGYRFAWDDLPKISFEDVAGLADVKEAVMRKVLLPLKNPELYEGYVKKNGGGLLLYGPPGTGKTMIAAAIAHEIGAKFCSLGPSDLVLGGIGNTEKACVQLFREARSFPCAVLFFDEMESICPVNTHAQGARQLRSELLRQIQGMEAYGEKNDQILFLIAATNKPWDIDPAFIRPGRFGTRIYVGLPDAPARRYMVGMRLQKIRSAGMVAIGDLEIDHIIERSAGFNGADVANLLEEAQEHSALRSIRTGVKIILQEDFEQAFEKVTSSVQERDLKQLTDWREKNG